MTHYHGTFLGGPNDGEILVATVTPIQVPRLPVEPVWAMSLEDLPPCSTYRVDLYHFHHDDDMRGWWLPATWHRSLPWG